MQAGNRRSKSTDIPSAPRLFASDPRLSFKAPLGLRSSMPAAPRHCRQKGHPVQTPYTPMQPPAPGARVIRFPEDRSYGEIVMRDWDTPVTGGFYGRWSDLGFERLAEARGAVAIPAGKEVRLALAEGVEGLGEGLGLLEPDDLQQVATDRYRNSVVWTDEDCRHLSRLRGLVWVSLIGTAIGDEGLRWLGQMPELRHLDLHRIDAITDEGISHLASLRKLETFFCPSPLLTDASMEIFGGWESLLQTRLQGDRITDGGMAHMAGCARLTNMFIPPGVTWRGAAHLHGLPLVTLVLWGNRNIGDRALEQLGPPVGADADAHRPRPWAHVDHRRGA